MPNKYRAKAITVDGERFDSRAEYGRWIDLQRLQELGDIENLERQTRIPLKCGTEPIKIRSEGYPNGRQIVYVADFSYYQNGELVFEDHKGKKRARYVKGKKRRYGTDSDVSRLKRAIVEARGEIFTLPAEHGIIRNLTRSPGVAERYPTWSPDGNRLAWVDQAMKIWIFDREKKTTTEVDQGLWMFHGGLSNFRVSWSPDSRWMAYSRGLDTRQRAIYIYDTDEGTRHQVTSGFYDDSAPVFDPEGKYLYFRSGRTMRPVYSDLDTTWVYNNSTNIVVVPLRKDVPSPLHQRNDDEELAHGGRG